FRSALELGGKSPHIVFDDANLEAAAENIVGGIFEGSGQSCVAGSRLFVQRGVYDRLGALLVDRAAKIRVGLPDVAGSEMGPLAGFAQRKRVERYVETARAEGGDILVGGKRPDAPELQNGGYYLPTIIGGLSNPATCVREEIFGPVPCVLPFEDEADLIAQANDSVYGLAG